MSQKAIKKRTIEHHKHVVKIPVKPIPNSNRQDQPKPLPQKSFPLNKFIALPPGLRPKTTGAQTEEALSPRRTTPVKAVGIPPGTTSSIDSRAHVYMVAEPQGDDQVTGEDYTHNTTHYHNDTRRNNNNTLTSGNSVVHTGVNGGVSVLVNGYTGISGQTYGQISSGQSRSHTRKSRADLPKATSTPRGDRRASPSPRQYNSAQTSPRGLSPKGSFTSVGSSSSESGSKPRRYKKRSQSAPPENERSRIQDTDFVLQQWNNEDIPGLTKNVSYETVSNDGLVIQSENWSSANVSLSKSGGRQTIYRTNSVNSRQSINTVSSFNTYNSDNGSTSSTSELEFTDVCNLNSPQRPNSVHSNNVSVKSLDFARRGDTYYTGDFTGINTAYTNNTDSDRYSNSTSDNQSIGNSDNKHTSLQNGELKVNNHKFIKSWSDWNLNRTMEADRISMASQRSMPRSYAVNGASSSGIVIYRPGHKNDRILVNDMPHGAPGHHEHQFLTVGRKQGTLMQSKMKFSSMPDMLDSKGDKKLFKILKKQEKEERKRKEKEEKKRAKEEKKRLKLEKKLATKTLPRNFAYQHQQQQYTNGHVTSPALEKVYRRPMLSMSTVPIDFEDGPKPSTKSKPAPKMAPPPLPEPSQRTMSMYASAPDLLRLEQVYGATLRRIPKDLHAPLSIQSDYGQRTVVLQRAAEGYGFVLRGAKSQLKPNGDLDFRPSAEFPALQYLDSVDPRSAADRAGLKGGDFILEINGENVIRASHDRVVHLIRGTGDTLAMKVVTVKPASRNPDWFVNQDKSLTMPNRKKKAPAPAPPSRDPRTSLSMSRSEGQSVSEELAVMEKLDQAIFEKKVSEEKKTASIRSRTAAKRVSCVDLENIGKENSIENTNNSPRHSIGNLERARSTPNLLDDKSRKSTIYASPTVPDKNSNPQKNIYATPNVNSSSSGSVVVSVNSSPTGVTYRPKGPPPPPPADNPSPRKQAPKPPVNGDVVTINTTSRHSHYASSNVSERSYDSSNDSHYESSFRPGASAKMTEEPVNASDANGLKRSHQRNPSAGAIHIDQNTSDNLDKQGVSFAEDKVFDHASEFLKKHPNAKLLVTTDATNRLKSRNSQIYEPEPDYDETEAENKVKLRENRQSVTVISVGDKKDTSTPSSKRYTIHSTIPTEDKSLPSHGYQSGYAIPPRPDGPAPKPPGQTQLKSTNQMQSERRKSPAPAPPATKVVQPIQNSPTPPLPKTPPPDFDEAPPSIPTAPPPPPAAPAPPPPPPPAPATSAAVVKESNQPPAIPTDAIAAAVAKRQARLEMEGPKIMPAKPKAQTVADSNQAAILMAVARRREKLEQQTDESVVDSIESRLQKTKKLQAAKFNISGSKVKKENEIKPEIKSNNVSQNKPNYTIPPKKATVTSDTVKDKPAKEENTAKPKELSFKVKTSNTSKSGLTEIKSNFSVKPLSKPTAVKTQESLKVKPEPLTKTITSTVNTQNGEKSKNEKNLNEQSDFLAIAEKKRQDWLLRKQKSPPESKASSPRSSSAGTPEKETFRTKTIEIKSVEKKSNSPPVSAKPKTNGAATTKDGSYSEFQSPQGLVKVRTVSNVNGDINKNESSRNYTNVPPPPPGFRDAGHVQNTVVQLEIIPPPTNFSSDSGTDMSSQHSPAFSPDTASVVSSLSTLSSLSGDQDLGDLIAPPPPGFGDGDVIPPPPEFGNENRKTSKTFSDKAVESWLCIDVLDWLDSLNMSQYKSSFQSNCIDGKKLLSLTRNNYIDLGVTQVGHRMNIERSIKKAAIQQNNNSNNIIATEHL